MKTIIILIIVALSTAILAVNPSSTNYILQQSSFGSGSDPANPPASANYVLEGSIVGTVSGDKIASSNFNNLLGYYLGEILGDILPPENVVISVAGSNVQLSWDASANANSYKVFSSDDPYSGFLEDTTGTFTGESWSAPAPNGKKFYYVKALH